MRDKACNGTIYRIAPKGFVPRVPNIDLTTTVGQITALKSPAVNVRYSGFIRLKAQGEKAVPAVAELLEDKNPYIAARAIWLLAQMGPAGVNKVHPLLDSKDEAKRIVTYRALRRAGQDVLVLAKKMALDASPAVRREVAISLRDFKVEQSRDILVQIAKQYDGKDRAYLEAFGTGSESKEDAVYAALRETLGAPASEWSESFARLAWRLHVGAAVPELKQRVLDAKLTPEQRKLALTTIAFTADKSAPEAMIALQSEKELPLKNEVQWWLRTRRSGIWKQFGLTQMLRERVS